MCIFIYVCAVVQEKNSLTIDAAHRIIVGYTEKARTKTVGYQQKEQRIGDGGKPMRVGISEYHFRAAVTE